MRLERHSLYPVGLTALLFVGLFTTRFYSFLLFHTITEFISIGVMWALFILVWNTRHMIDNPAVLFLGITFFFVGWVDMLHTLAYKGMSVFPEYGANLPTQLWVAGRYLFSGCLIVASFLLDRPVKPLSAMLLLAGITALLITSVFGGLFPDCFLEDTGLTAFKRGSEYLICAMLIVAMVLFYRRRDRFDSKVLRLILLFIGASIVSGLFFTFYVSVYGLSNFIGHFFKLIAMLFLYGATVETGIRKPFSLLFRDLKSREESLRESEERFRRMFRGHNAIMLLLDRETGVIIDANQAAAGFYGYSLAQLCQMTIHQVNTLPAEEVDRQLTLAFEEKCNYFIFPHRLAGGEIRNVEVHSSPIRVQDKTVLFSIIHDITERKQAEAALRENEEIFEQFMEHSPIYIFFKDEMIRSIRLSRNFEKMLGRPLDEILGKTMDELFPSDLARSMIADDRRILNGGKVFHVEEELNGRVYTTIKFPIYLHGKPRYLAGYTIDITDRRQAEAEKRHLEERLQRAEKMEALGTLAGGVAHDLNNVLGVVVGYSELLLDDLEASNPLRQGIETIMTGGQKAAAIVQDLLTLARRGVPGRNVLNLNKVIVANLNSPEIENLSSHHSGVRILTALDPDLLNISGSAVHLGKTLFNLVSNAAEAMPEGGALSIQTANQYLDKPLNGYDEIREGDYVVLSVSDTGEGISETDLKRIFEPFYTKKMMGRSGTGLGLAVVWGTVKDHHGYINVQSEAGRGSTFTLYFPVTREELTAEDVSIPVSEYRGKGETLLVVDDVREQRELATTMLKKLNYRVESVSGGEEALAYLRAHPVDLMVLDMIMDPGMDGLDTYRSVLDIRPGQKAIIVSGFSESERVNAAQALGAGAYVRKPYVLEKLGLAVKRALARTDFGT